MTVQFVPDRKYLVRKTLRVVSRLHQVVGDKGFIYVAGSECLVYRGFRIEEIIGERGGVFKNRVLVFERALDTDLIEIELEFFDPKTSESYLEDAEHLDPCLQTIQRPDLDCRLKLCEPTPEHLLRPLF